MSAKRRSLVGPSGTWSEAACAGTLPGIAARATATTPVSHKRRLRRKDLGFIKCSWSWNLAWHNGPLTWTAGQGKSFRCDSVLPTARIYSSAGNWPELGGESLAEKVEPGVRVLLISIEETPAFYILIANVPAASGDATRISRFVRGGPPSVENLSVRRRLLKELIWEQQEPILDAVETGGEGSKMGPPLILK